MPNKTNKTITLSAGHGVILTNDGVGFDGTTPISHTISLGQDINTFSDVQFNAITASAQSNPSLSTVEVNGYKLFANRWTNNFTAGGSINVTENLTILGNATVGGKVTAERIETEVSSSTIIFKSGSTQWGDDIGDTHHITGSVHLSGSFSLLGYSVNEISNDITLADGSSTALATESASAAYIETQLGSVTEPNETDLYLRKNYNKNATSILNNTASFTAITASAPSGVTETSEDDFIFFNNGNIMEHDAITIQQSGSTFLLIVDNNSLGYNLDSDDEIKAWGRFNG